MTAAVVLGADSATSAVGAEGGGDVGAGLVGNDDGGVLEGDGVEVALVTRVV